VWKIHPSVNKFAGFLGLETNHQLDEFHRFDWHKLRHIRWWGCWLRSPRTGGPAAAAVAAVVRPGWWQFQVAYFALPKPVNYWFLVDPL